MQVTVSSGANLGKIIDPSWKPIHVNLQCHDPQRLPNLGVPMIKSNSIDEWKIIHSNSNGLEK